MKNRFTKLLALGMSAIMMAGTLVGCGSSSQDSQKSSANEADSTESQSNESTVTASGEKAPKYVFLFIGDGMSYPQVETTDYYLSALENGSSMGSEEDGTVLTKSENAVSFVNFPVIGSAQTYSSTSFVPDSASTGTAIASGHKTHTGILNMDETGTESYETIAEQLRDQLGYKIGIVTSVNINHATPAAFYAHEPSRVDYYDIGEDLISSDFDYFAGGAFLSPTGENEDKTSLYQLAQEASYKVVKKQAEAEKVTADDGKVILIDEHLANCDTMNYEIDRKEGEWALSDYVAKGIDCLYGNNDSDNNSSDNNSNNNDGDNSGSGFFMMVEGGKIDWACHANDAATTIADTKAFSDAVEEALDFYEEHPDETLILVTGDHETGGLSIGYAGTNYDTFLQNLKNQKISYQEFNDEYVDKYKENGTKFDDVMSDITELFGLTTEKSSGEDADETVVEDETDNHETGVISGSLVLTDAELQKLKDAYNETMTRKEDEEQTQEEYVLYGSYDPLTVTVTHILNNKSGITFSSYSHTGLPAAVFAKGVGQENFTGYYDNTDIYKKMAALLGIQ